MATRTPDIKKLLQHVPLFRDLDTPELEQLASLARHRVLGKGNVIFYEDDPGTSCYLIVKGKVKIVVNADDGREHILGVLQDGDFFGEMSLIDGESRSASAIAVDEVQMVTVQRDEFLKLLRSNPEISLKLLVTLSQRLRAADRNMESLAFLSAPGRVARLLLELAKEHGEASPEGVVFTHTMTRQELASLAGTSRETLTRVLMDYQDRGIILLDKNRLVLRNEGKLRDMMV
ncbi:MAG: Crp/Fnr family transcriptional regulator [Candidatus Sericytochromatia bacterium]|nr:Crp/Fnr family transcriptional regulator [Candidatus Sericytochromatia bacterium]